VSQPRPESGRWNACGKKTKPTPKSFHILVFTAIDRRHLRRTRSRQWQNWVSGQVDTVFVQYERGCQNRVLNKRANFACLVKQIRRCRSSGVLLCCEAKLPEISVDGVGGGVCCRSPRDFRVVAHSDFGLRLNAEHSESSSRGITVVVTQRPAQSFTAMHYTTALPHFAARLDDSIVQSLMIPFLMVMRQIRNCGSS